MSLAATLDKQITPQVRVAGQDAYGSPSQTWENLIPDGDGKVWAGIVDVSGREFLAAGGTQNAATTKITIRHMDGLDGTVRALHGATVYNIEAVLGQDGRTLLLMCSRGANLG